MPALYVTTSRARTSVGSPSYQYESMLPYWKRSRAIIEGEQSAKIYDEKLRLNGDNLLIPFGPSMNPDQYQWFVSEAELPGLVSQYLKTVVGGLLRKEPDVNYKSEVPDEIKDWIKSDFSEDGKSLVAFLSEAIEEELTTRRAFVTLNFPVAPNFENIPLAERKELSPFPQLWRAEQVINWAVRPDSRTGEPTLSRAVISHIAEDYSDNEYHPVLVPTIIDHFLDEGGVYRVQYYERESSGIVKVINGRYELDEQSLYTGQWVAVGELQTPMVRGQPLNYIPGWFLSGDITPTIPLFSPLVDREISLYNKVSRRNHLLYGAATYTPVIFSDGLMEDEFETIVQQGLGTWIRLGREDKIDVLKTPTEALVDLDRAIESTVTEMARLGIRMLSPEQTGQSGIALEIRNSPQTAQLGVINTRISMVITEILKVMIWWKTGLEADLDFNLSADFNPSPIGPEWLKLVGDWYESRKLPRSTFIRMLKEHDILPGDYDDDDAMKEIQEDPLTESPTDVEIQE